MFARIIFVLVLAFRQLEVDAAPVRGNPVGVQRFPAFMRQLYDEYVSAIAPFSKIVHSNAAIAVNRSNFTFEAMFSELGFLQHENLKRAQLRLNIVGQLQQCNLPELNVRVTEHKSGQLFGDYVMFPSRPGVNTLVLTKSLRKLASGFSGDRKLKVRITLRNPDTVTSPCSNVVGGLSKEAYLVTNTDEVATRKRRHLPNRSRSASEIVTSIFRRLKRSRPTCAMEEVTVNLTSSNNSIFILPTSFKTGICGLQHAVPLSNDAMIQALARAITSARSTLPPSSNAQCCLPSKFQKLTVLYFDSMQHVVLRHVNNVKVTGCACSNST